jgi:hypothetical protein
LEKKNEEEEINVKSGVLFLVMWLGLVPSLLSVVVGLRWSFEIVLVVVVG